MPAASPRNPHASVMQRLRALWPHFRGGRRAYGVALLAIAVGAATEPLMPALIQPLLDKGFQGGGLPLWTIPASLLLLFTVRGGASFLAQYALTHASSAAMLALRRAMFAKLMTARMDFFGRTSASALSNTLVYEVQTGATYLVNSILPLFKESLSIVALLAYLFYLNWQLTLVAAIIFPAVAVVMKVLSRRLHKLARTGQEATDELAYVVEENVLAHRMVRLHQAQAAQAGRFDRLSVALRRLAIKSTVASAAMTPLTQLLSAVALSVVICTALWQSGAQSGASQVTVGEFVAFLTAMLMLISPIKHLSEVINPLTRGIVALERGVDLIEQVPDETEGAHDVERGAGAMRLRAAGVSYSGDDAQPALADIELDIAPGRVVALVGSSGAGKTTLVNLLPRFIDASSGTVEVDGVDVRHWRLASLRRQFAFVSQDVVMFNDSIAANVALGVQPIGAAERRRIEAALQAANLLDFVHSLPEGIDAPVGHNASQLSGGQRQRLAIARALYKDAPILVLDEATSALDTESERLVQESLKRLMTGRTTLIIAHRLSTVAHADQIVVMDAGRVVETGTHAELLARRGHYARLHRLMLDPA